MNVEDHKDDLDIRIYYEDTDCGGVVYYGKYLAFLERARTEYLESRGISLAELMDEGIYFVVVKVDISYRMPARYGDIISVSSVVTDSSNVSVVFHHDIRKKGTEDLIAEATVKLACVGRDMKPARMNSVVSDALRPG